MKKKMRIVLIVALILAFSTGYAIINKTNAIYDVSYDTENYIGVELLNNDSVTQRFVCNEKNLDGISLKITGQGDMSGSALSYELSEVDSGKVVSIGTQNIDKLESGKFYNLTFEKVEGTEEKEYQLTISLKSGESGIVLYYTPDDNNTFQKNKSELNGTLVLRTVTHRFDFETFLVTLCFVVYIIGFMKWIYNLFK